jgi:uncharacterized membrane protein HdeD (DUF308 family)
MVLNRRHQVDKRVLKWGGVAAVAVGSVALYMAGVGEQAVTGVVGGVFVLAGIIAAIIKS